MAKKNTAQIIKETEQYVAFLEKRLASKNYQARVSADEQQKEREKLKKARTRLKLLKPNLLEMILEMIIGIVDDAMDVDDLHPYIPLLGSLMVFVLVANLISIVPVMKSPTADINTTIGLALVIVLSVHIYGILKKGFWTYLKEFASPIVLFPIELIGQVSRTLSLAMRLFGNVLSGDLVVAIVFSIIPSVLPIAMIAISMISGALQAYVIDRKSVV